MNRKARIAMTRSPAAQRRGSSDPDGSSRQGRTQLPVSNSDVQRTEQQLRAEREQECAKQINALLAQFACRFQTMVVIVDGQIETRVNVVAL